MNSLPFVWKPCVRVCMSAALVLLAVGTLSAEPADGTVIDGSVNPEATVGGSFFRYHERSQALSASPGALRSGLLGFANPAMIGTTGEPDAMLSWSADLAAGHAASGRSFSVFTGFPGLGFGVRSVAGADSALRIHDYRVSAGAQFDGFAAGVGYGWYGGDLGLLPGSQGLERNLSAGALMRAGDYTSIGLFGTAGVSGQDFEGVADFAVRPLADERLTLFGEYAVDSDRPVLEGRWSAGAVGEPAPGLRLTARYVENRGLEAGIGVSLGRLGASYRRQTDPFDEGGQGASPDRFTVRLGAYDRNVRDAYFADETRYLEVDLDDTVAHRPRFMFDPRPTVHSITEAIRKAGEDPTVAGIVVNGTDMRLSQAIAWEIGAALQRFSDRGKRVVVYLERAGMDALHILSAADRVVMDPEGSLNLSGFVSSSTYLADLLESSGIGVVEFRRRDYKSAFETFSRSEMSSEDREQRQAFVDAYYETVRARTVEGRDITEEEFDRLVDYGPSILADELSEAGLVDSTARYPDIDGEIDALEQTQQGGGPVERIRASALAENRLPEDDRWQPRPRIGVVYATGLVSTDTGMRAREVASELRRMRRDTAIEGVVLRVNSPGGDILASDLVAEEVRSLSEAKPTAVSMAGTAASGGYWISMYADRIFAQPTTITGSIGVISGWLYDDGFSDRINIEEDSVQRGESADLFVGPVLPLVNLGLWPREPDAREREQFMEQTRTWYERFVSNVAEARNMDQADVEEVARGRVWTGEAAVERGLVDELGSLEQAIDYVRTEAGIAADRRIRIEEGPSLAVLPVPAPFPDLLASAGIYASVPDPRPDYLDPTPQATGPTGPRESLLYDYLKTTFEHAGQRPVALLPFEYLHWYYREAR